jgi:outer membrane protein assembly factor BamB
MPSLVRVHVALVSMLVSSSLTHAAPSTGRGGEILWTFDAKGCIYSSPAIRGDLVFLAPCRGVIFALDKRTGAVRWSYDARENAADLEFHGDPLFTDDLLVVGSDTEDKTISAPVLALEQSTGKLRWKYPAGPGVASDIVRDGERLFMTSRNSELVCLDLATGRELWSFKSKRPADEMFTTSSTPVLSGDRVFFAGANGMIHAVDRMSGKAIWEHDGGRPMTANLSLVNGSLYTAMLDGHLYRLNADTGVRLGELSLGGFVATPLSHTSQGLFLLTATSETEGELVAVDFDLKRVQWRRKPKGARWTSARPYLWGNDGVLVGSGGGQLIVFSAVDGSELWSETLAGAPRGIGWEADVLYIGMMDGTLHAYRAPSAWKRSLGDRVGAAHRSAER